MTKLGEVHKPKVNSKVTRAKPEYPLLCVASKKGDMKHSTHLKCYSHNTKRAVSTKRMVSSVGCTTQIALPSVPLSQLPSDLTERSLLTA